MKNCFLGVVAAILFSLISISAHAGIVGGENSIGRGYGSIHVSLDSGDECIFKDLSVYVGGSKDYLIGKEPTTWMQAVVSAFDWCRQIAWEEKSDYSYFDDHTITYKNGVIAVRNVSVELADASGNIISVVSFDGTLTSHLNGWQGVSYSKNNSADPRTDYKSEDIQNGFNRDAYVSGTIMVGSQAISTDNAQGSISIDTINGWWQMEDNLPVEAVK